MSSTELRHALVKAASELYAEQGLIETGRERQWGLSLTLRMREAPDLEAVHAEPLHGDLTWDWTRPPGRIDLVWQIAGERGAAELKLRKPEELTWDLMKLAEHTGTDREFAFAALLVQVEPTDLTKMSGALLSGEHTGIEHPVDWIRRWPSSWRWLMCGGRGIRPRTLMHGVELSEPIVIGDPTRTHWIILPVKGASDDRDDLDEWGWPPSLGDRPDDWRDRVIASDTPAKR